MRKRVLFISHSAGFSGAEISLYKLLKGLDSGKYRLAVLFPKDGPLVGKARDLGHEILISPYPWWIAYGRRTRNHLKDVLFDLPGRTRILRGFLRERKIDLVYTNTVTCIDGAIAAKREGVPHLWHIREHITGHPDLRPYVPKPVVSWLVNFLSDRVVVPSYSVKNEYDRRGGSGKFEVVYNGVDVDAFVPAESPSDASGSPGRVGVDRRNNTVALIGYFHEIKGQMDFVEAARRVSDAVPDAAFLLVGDGVGNREYTRSVKRRVTELGLDDRVRFMPFQEHIHPVYRAIDVCVSASRVESFSNVLCEAMAAGKPVVATRSGGPEELVVDGETGYLVPARDPDRLAGAIVKLLGNMDEAAAMGRKGRERVKEHFRQDQYVANIQRIIEGLVG